MGECRGGIERRGRVCNSGGYENCVDGRRECFGLVESSGVIVRRFN